jgi:hypothetical protein
MDLDYRALSNAGLWCIGRLQTDSDRARVLDGLSASMPNERGSEAELGRTIQRLNNRWFIVRNAHASSGPILMQPRHTLSWLRGPMTRQELRTAIERRGAAAPSGMVAPAETLASRPTTSSVSSTGRDASSRSSLGWDYLGLDFLRISITVVALILDNPQRWRLFQGTRCVLLSPFPYAIVYREVTPDEIEILGVAHFERRPKYWSARSK